MLCGLLMLYVENPRLFAIAPMVVPLAALLVLFRVIGVLRYATGSKSGLCANGSNPAGRGASSVHSNRSESG
jgi:hypothetical protein